MFRQWCLDWMRAIINSRDVAVSSALCQERKRRFSGKGVLLQRVIALNRRVQTDRFFGGFPSMQAWHKLCRLRLREVAYHGGG